MHITERSWWCTVQKEQSSKTVTAFIATCRRDVHCGDTTANAATPQLWQPRSVVFVRRLAAATSLFGRWTLGSISRSTARFGTTFPFVAAVLPVVWLRWLGCFAVVFFNLIRGVVVGCRLLGIVTVATAGTTAGAFAITVATTGAALVAAPAARATLLAVTSVTVMGTTAAAVSVPRTTTISWRPATSVRSTSWTWSTDMRQTQNKL